MMSLSPNDKCKQRMCKIPTSKTLQEGAPESGDDDRPCKICRTTSSSMITNLPGDCLNLIFQCLKTRDDRNSFGLTCHPWLRIQNNNRESLWWRRRHDYLPNIKYPKISPESFALIICNLLFRFQHLDRLSLERCPGITEIVTSKSQSFRSNVRSLGLRYCSVYSDMQLSLVFSWFPRLTYITLYSSIIGDKGLEALAICCPFLETADLSQCSSITDSGLSFLIQNCRKLGSVHIAFCNNVTGISFLGCPPTLNLLAAGGCRLNQEGIETIVSGGGLKYLYLETPDELLAEVVEGCISTEAVITISKGCPLLKELFLSNCEEVELEGWEAIGLNCKELDYLQVMGCQKLCDLGLQAILYGCNKLTELHLDREKNSCSSSALELFVHKNPNVMLCLRT